MRKTTLGGVVVAVAAVVWGAGLYVSGMWVERAFQDNLEALSGHPQVELESTSYERGWLRARARSRLTLTTPEQEVTFRLKHQIAHGPTFTLAALARITTTPIIPADKAEVTAHYFGDRAPFKSHLRIGLTGSHHWDVASPAFHRPLHNDPETEVDWQGLSGKGTVSAGHDRFRLELNVPGLNVAEPEGEIDLRGLSVRSSLEKQSDHLWLGNSRLALEGLDADLPAEDGNGRRQARFQGLTLHTTLAEGQAEDLLRMRADWDLQSAEMDGRSLNNGALGLELRRIDQTAYRDLQARAGDLRARELSQEALAGAYLELVQDLLPRFLARSPELEITRLVLETGDGRLQGNAQASYRGKPESQGVPGHINQVLRRVTARAEMTMAKDLLTALLRRSAEANLAAKEGVPPDQAAQQAAQVAQMRLGMLQGLGIVEADGNRFTVAAAWEEGTVTVNGQPLGMGGSQIP